MNAEYPQTDGDIPAGEELCRAVLRDDRTAVTQLLATGIDVNAPGRHGATALMMAPNVPMAALLLAAGAQIERMDEFGSDALAQALAAENNALVAYLIGVGADINRRNRHGWTRLREAAFSRAPAAVAQLLALGADPSLDRGKLLSAASWYATAGDNPAVAETIALLVAAGEDVNATDGYGYGPLHCAVHGYHHTPDEATWWNASSDGSDVSATRALLAHGANPNLAGANGMTPLLLAVESSYESTPCVAALLEQGADPALAGHGGITPLMRAVNAGEAENVRLLLAHGVDVQQRDRYGHDALHYATQRLQQLTTPEQADEDENEEADQEMVEPELRAWMAELSQRAIDKAALCMALLKTALG